MLNFARTDPRLLDDVGAVVDELVTKAGIEPDRVMLVGARCRDAIHSALGQTTVNRATDDLDVGVALSDWAAFERIDQAFTRAGRNGIRYRIWDMSVDVMPFGPDIENPSGISTPRTRRDGIVVFGFEDVFEVAERISLPGVQHRIRIPGPAGYAALKVRAWVDRSAYGQFKDADDVALVLDWYDDSDEVAARLYDAAGALNITQRYDFDTRLATAHLLGQDIREQLTSEKSDELAGLFAESNLDRFAQALRGDPGDPGFAREVALVIGAGIADSS